jgi:ferredoxin-like protein FixX
MRTDGIFIGIAVDDDALAAESDLAKHLDTVCPVDIYKEVGDGGLEIVERNVDECVLCKLCLDTAHLDVAEDAVRVIKLYDGGAILE